MLFSLRSCMTCDYRGGIHAVTDALVNVLFSGLFKIEDSEKLAQLWGECKNCPTMNYDKLSRSIRQYYKNGIIHKTATSQRLVYQFCVSYL